MKRACIFDFDGVLIDNERFWEAHKKIMFLELYGESIAENLDKTLGANMDAIHDMATSLGSTVPVARLYDLCDKHALQVYAEAPITPGVDDLLEKLITLNYSLGIVSASPKSWITIALARMAHQGVFSQIISLHDRADLAHKPDPAGYIAAMRLLDVAPPNTIIVEDSNLGVQSAKSSGAYTIGLRQNLIPGYPVSGAADIYVDTISEVATIAASFRNRKS